MVRIYAYKNNYHVTNQFYKIELDLTITFKTIEPHESRKYL